MPGDPFIQKVVPFVTGLLQSTLLKDQESLEAQLDKELIRQRKASTALDEQRMRNAQLNAFLNVLKAQREDEIRAEGRAEAERKETLFPLKEAEALNKLKQSQTESLEAQIELDTLQESTAISKKLGRPEQKIKREAKKENLEIDQLQARIDKLEAEKEYWEKRVTPSELEQQKHSNRIFMEMMKQAQKQNEASRKVDTLTVQQAVDDVKDLNKEVDSWQGVKAEIRVEQKAANIRAFGFEPILTTLANGDPHVTFSPDSFRGKKGKKKIADSELFDTLGINQGGI